MKIERRQWIGWWRANPWRVDVALAVLVAVIEIAGTYFAAQHQPEHRTLDAVGLALLALGAAALVLRRKYPGWVLIFVLGTTLCYLLLDYPKGPNFLSMLVAFYTAVAQGRRYVAWAVLSTEFVLFPWVQFWLGNEPAPNASGMFGMAGWLVVLAIVAELAHVRQQRSLRAREDEARQHAAAERLRIARELHDVLGHHISLISVQAGVALHLMEQQPEQARSALTVIREASREALRELRSVLDVLRELRPAQEDAPRAPAPGLAGLAELVARAAEAGLQVRTEVSGDLQRLPASVDLAAFRIVQEALTNVMRHAGQSRANVQVRCDERELTLRIENEAGPAGGPEGSGSGQGIIGMRERAAALGGVLEAGGRPDGGFRVVARLPLDGGTR